MGDPVTIGVKVALTAAQMALTMTNKIEGPRLDNLEVTTADYGTPLNYFWGKKRLEGVPIIWAEKLREKKTNSKTKGGKYSEYKYFGTFAVAIADHEIDQVSRIWMDKHLVFDLTKEGPISVLSGFFSGLGGAPVKLNQGRNMRIYLGTETQEPDPRMEAWCEDRYGADSCPAYKGVAYIVFEDLPLEKFGNRIPQITVEAVNNSNTEYLLATESLTSDTGGVVFSTDYSRFYVDGSIWDTATMTRMHGCGVVPEAISSGGTIYNRLTGPPRLQILSLDGQLTQAQFEVGATFDRVRIFLDEFGQDLVFLGTDGGTTYQQVTGAAYTLTDVDFHTTLWAQDNQGNVWVGGRYHTLSGDPGFNLRCVYGAREGASAVIATGSTGDPPALFINSRDEFIIAQGGTTYRVDSEFNVLQTASIADTGSYTAARGADSFWRVTASAALEYSMLDLSLIRSESESSWGSNISGGQYEPITHAIVSVSGDNVLRWFYLDRVGSNGTDLGDIVQDVADRCGVVELDVTDLDQLVPGYSVVQGAGKDWIAPLLDIHDVDARPHDFAVQFLTRGSASEGTIAVSDFVREGDEPRYQVTIKQDTDLPRRVALSYADNTKDQQKNTVISQRPLDGTDSKRELTIDLSTYAASPGDAQKFADRYFRRQWIGREGVNNALTAQYMKLEPGDVWNLQLDDVTQTHRLKKMTFSQGRINCEWERDFASIVTLGTGEGAEMDGRDDDVIYVPSPTKGFVLDIPLVSDSHDLSVPQLYYAAGNYGAGNWPGGTIYESDLDSNEFNPWNTIEAADKAGWGYATNALGDANPWLWDRGNTLNVTFHGTLTSSTEAAIDADPTINMAVVGFQGRYEILNFTTATLESDGSYTLSGFKRGRRGTEGNCGSHTAGDEFILVSDLERDGFGLSDVGTDKLFRAQTVGRDVAAAPDINVEFGGATLLPYAPAHLKWTTDGTDLFGEIVRRTRVGGAWSGGSAIPLSENSEAYEVDIMDGDTVVRTIEVTGTNTFTYTSAQMSADGTSASSPPAANVYQLSDAVGRGFALAA